MMRSLLFVLGGFVFGGLVTYVAILRKMLSMQEEIIQKSQPPLKATRVNWWENNQPETDDEYKLTLARRDWLREFFVKFVYPYIDKNAASILMEEFLTPLNRRLAELEIQELDESRQLELMAIQSRNQSAH